MNTPHTVFQNPRVILRMLTIVSIAVALIGAKLPDVLEAISVAEGATAGDSLSAFISECQAQSGKKLTADQAAQFINSANQLKSELDCH